MNLSISINAERAADLEAIIRLRGRLPFWLRASLWWGEILLLWSRFWWPLFGVHLKRASVLWWAMATGDLGIDSLDPRARKAFRSVALKPAPSARQASAIEVVPEFED